MLFKPEYQHHQYKLEQVKCGLSLNPFTKEKKVIIYVKPTIFPNLPPLKGDIENQLKVHVYNSCEVLSESETNKIHSDLVFSHIRNICKY